MEGFGRIVIVTGPSSAGKTTLTTAFRDRSAERGTLWIRVGIDLILAELPGPWVDVGWPGGAGAFASDGMRVVGGRHIEVGAVLRTLLRSYQRLAVDIARSGNDVLVDDCILDGTMWLDWQEALVGLDATWVGVTAVPDVLAGRERARGDRPLGLAAAQRHSALAFLGDAPLLDTSSASLDSLVSDLDRIVSRAGQLPDTQPAESPANP